MCAIPAVPTRRDRILHRDRLRCVYCAATFAAEELTLDHVQPRMRGGDDSDGNLVASCGRCNALKGGLAAWDFLARRPDLRKNFVDAAETADVRHARPVWSRLLRAIREAAAAQRNSKGPLELSSRKSTLPTADDTPTQP